jgi:hypothetical protein
MTIQDGCKSRLVHASLRAKSNFRATLVVVVSQALFASHPACPKEMLHDEQTG